MMQTHLRREKHSTVPIGGLCAALILLIAQCAHDRPASIATADVDSPESISALFVAAGAPPDGDGTKAKPFATLARVEAVAQPGATIFILPSINSEPLDGGIALKSDQKLIGLGPGGATAAVESEMPRMTNSTAHLDGVIVQLAERNEVAGIHFVDLRNHGIYASGIGCSGARIHHNRFTGAAPSEEIIWSVALEADSGAVTGVTVTDCIVRDGESLGGIQVMHTGASTGDYEFARNDFSDLGGRAYLVWSRGTSKISSRILDSVADNIGLGDKNSDSIDPRLWGSSQQNMYVSNYRYNNTKQVGSRSNTGFEAFIMGAPFPDEPEWCKNCSLTLEIVDSVFENPITDGIQLTNFGTNSTFDIKIRNTKVINPNPQQAGGAISLIAQNERNTGSRTKLLVENCDLIGSKRFGFAITDRGEGYTSVVDLGGGELGSAGKNRIIGSADAEIHVVNANPVAKNNWWGTIQPRVSLEGANSTADLEPPLSTDPRHNETPLPRREGEGGG